VVFGDLSVTIRRIIGRIWPFLRSSVLEIKRQGLIPACLDYALAFIDPYSYSYTFALALSANSCSFSYSLSRVCRCHSHAITNASYLNPSSFISRRAHRCACPLNVEFYVRNAKRTRRNAMMETQGDAFAVCTSRANLVKNPLEKCTRADCYRADGAFVFITTRRESRRVLPEKIPASSKGDSRAEAGLEGLIGDLVSRVRTEALSRARLSSSAGKDEEGKGEPPGRAEGLSHADLEAAARDRKAQDGAEAPSAGHTASGYGHQPAEEGHRQRHERARYTRHAAGSPERRAQSPVQQDKGIARSKFAPSISEDRQDSMLIDRDRSGEIRGVSPRAKERERERERGRLNASKRETFGAVPREQRAVPARNGRNAGVREEGEEEGSIQIPLENSRVRSDQSFF